MAKVVEFCQFRLVEGRSPEDVEQWETDFIVVTKTTLFSLILVANFLQIQPPLDLACLLVSDMIRGKSTDEIRAEFDIPDEFSAEELEDVRRNNEWAG